MIIDMFNKIGSPGVLVCSEQDFNIDISIKTDVNISKLTDFQIYMKILNECKCYEFKIGDIFRTLSRSSNCIFQEIRRGFGNYCCVSESFLELLIKECYPYTTQDNGIFLVDRYKMNISLPFEDPVCIMTYKGKGHMLLDGGIVVLDGDKLVFHPDWKRYIRVITNSNNEINHAWKMFIGDNK